MAAGLQLPSAAQWHQLADPRGVRGGDVGWPSGRGFAPPYGPANEPTTDSLIAPGTRTGEGSKGGHLGQPCQRYEVAYLVSAYVKARKVEGVFEAHQRTHIAVMCG